MSLILRKEHQIGSNKLGIISIMDLKLCNLKKSFSEWVEGENKRYFRSEPYNTKWFRDQEEKELAKENEKMNS